MRIVPAEAQAALERGDVLDAGAVKIGEGLDAIRLWSGHGPFTLDGEIYDGVGDRGLIASSGGTLGGAEQGLALSLSGVDPDALSLLELEPLRHAPVLTWRLTFDAAGTHLLEARRLARGRVDTVETEETPGGTATIRIEVEGAARGLGRRGGRTRTDADQRLIESADDGMKSVNVIGGKKLYWGGKPPQPAGQALPGAGSRGFVGAGLKASLS